MTYSDMRVGLRYIVVEPSACGEFQIGDHIRVLDDGAILNMEAGGWIPKEYVEVATENMVVELDKKWISCEKIKLKKKLQYLNEV